MTSEVNEVFMPIFSKKPALVMMLTCIITLAGLFVSGCDESVNSASSVHSASNQKAIISEISGPIMGTSYHIKVVLTPNKDSLDNLSEGVSKTLKRVDTLMSTYKSNSEISRFNRLPNNTWFEVSPETFRVISLGQSISEKSKGYYDMTVGPLVNSWGFGPSGKPVEIPDEGQLHELLSRVGFTHLKLDETTLSIMKDAEIYLDLSSIAKGYAVDAVANYLDENSVDSYLVEVGGEIRAQGEKPNGNVWRLAIESPEVGLRSVHKVIDLTNAGLATSGDYRNYYEEAGVRYSHTINPFTGKPVQHKLTSVSVIRPTSAEADAMATMFMVMGAERGYKFAVEHKVAAYFIYRSDINSVDDSAFKSKSTKEFNIYLTQ